VDLIEFLGARLGEDEAAARACDMWPAPWSSEPNGSGWTVQSWKSGVPAVAHCEWSRPARHIARWDPARVLAEVEAKRRVIELLDVSQDPAMPAEAWILVTRIAEAMACAWADHPDFDPAWLTDVDTR
jgi:hypothetical protein